VLARKGCGSVRGSDDDALPCPRLTASGGSNVSTDDGSGCDDGSGGSETSKRVRVSVSLAGSDRAATAPHHTPTETRDL